MKFYFVESAPPFWETAIPGTKKEEEEEAILCKLEKNIFQTENLIYHPR